MIQASLTCAPTSSSTVTMLGVRSPKHRYRTQPPEHPQPTSGPSIADNRLSPPRNPPNPRSETGLPQLTQRPFLTKNRLLCRDHAPFDQGYTCFRPGIHLLPTRDTPASDQGYTPFGPGIHLFWRWGTKAQVGGPGSWIGRLRGSNRGPGAQNKGPGPSTGTRARRRLLDRWWFWQ